MNPAVFLLMLEDASRPSRPATLYAKGSRYAVRVDDARELVTRGKAQLCEDALSAPGVDNPHELFADLRARREFHVEADALALLVPPLEELEDENTKELKRFNESFTNLPSGYRAALTDTDEDEGPPDLESALVAAAEEAD